jgi:16S rRNA (adenine1518-N6/adenine1519-N6)-dimethyltransferase
MRQKWGQNFLTDDGACRRIVQSLGAGPSDRVVEIGPGKGALSRFMVGQVAALTLVELDAVLAARLSSRWSTVEGLTVVCSDFLEWSPPDVPAGDMKVIGNLPYSAAGAILRRLLDWSGWCEAVVMVQKEVAERIVAGPGTRDYGILSLAIQSKAEASLLFDVGPRSFTPPPKVVSTVLRLRRLATPRMADEGKFFRVVKAAFGQRRKTLLNSLSHGLDAEKPVVESALRACGVDPAVRAETIDLATFDRLSRLL